MRLRTEPRSGRATPPTDRPTTPAGPPGIARTSPTPPRSGRGLAATIIVGHGEPPEHLFRRLLGAYLSGAEEFIVRERSTIRSDTREVIRSFCRRTRQPEIISEEGGVVRLRDLAFDTPVSLSQRVPRMGRMVVDFHRDVVESWSRLPFGEDDLWSRRDDEIDREAWYIERSAVLGADGSSLRLLGPYTIARSLERIADHAVVLGETGRRLVDLPQAVGPLTSLRQFHRQAMEHLEGVLVVSNGAGANDLLDTGEALLASGRALADRLLPAVEGGTMSPATAGAIARILESIGRTVAYGQDIAQVALDRSLLVAPREGGGTSPRLVAASSV